MSDTDPTSGNDKQLLLLPAPDAKAAAESSTTPPGAEKPLQNTPVKSSRPVWPYWLAAGFIILAGGEAYLFVQQQAHQADKTALAVLQVEVSDLRADAAKTSPLAALLGAQAELTQKQVMLAAQLTALQNQVASDHSALAALQINAQEISQLTTRMTWLNDITAARMALQTGQPLGTIPKAPAALAIFATTPPPTMLQLKASFPASARRAEAASLENNGQVGFWSKVKLRLEGLITISDGQHVLFGPPAAATLNLIRAALAEDDLTRAVAAAETLPPSTQTAMADWLTPARQLLAAQQALAAMARQEN